MKLHEIINTEIIKNKSDVAPDYDNNLGGGYDAMVYRDKEDPHMVVKNIHFNSKYSYYINQIILRGMSGVNPYVPRVYKKSKDDKQYQIERLVPLDDLTRKELAYIFNHAFGFDYSETDDLDGRASMSKVISDNIRSAVEYGTEVKSDDLNQVISLIRDIIKKDKTMRNDMRENNIMARRTPYGAQLVITDPVV